jgi:Na+-transporting NADH:ubiquinone oxidoreductase subunit NqrC
MWLKKLRQRKLQSVLIFIIVFVCSILMTSSIVIMTSLQKPYKELSKDCDSPKVKLYPFEMPQKKLEQV